MTKPTKAELTDAYQDQLDTNVMLEERMAELELALEDVGWLRLTFEGAQDFTRQGLAKIIELSRLMARKNPLINHAVDVTSGYVFGQGVSTQLEDDRLNDVWQDFWQNGKNKKVLTGHRARIENEQELEVTGNLFYPLFTNISTGRVRVGSIPVEEIQDIITNPDNSKDPWYYRRVWSEQAIDLRRSGITSSKPREAFYPDMDYYPTARPPTFHGKDVMWESPVYHVKVGGSSHMKFGVPEVYPALDWARAVKEFLEDVATTHRALARFAWNLTTKGGVKGVAAVKAKLGTGISGSPASAETNPPPTVGSVFTQSEGVNMAPIKTAGMAPGGEEGRGLRLMTAAGTGIPETILFGDADVGNLATAKTLDRPTELKMRSRQELWTGIYQDLADYVLLQAVLTASGGLRGVGRLIVDPQDASRSVVWTQDVTPTLNVDWPPILEHDVAELVGAIVKAATLDGKPSADLIDRDAVARMLLAALGEDNIDELLAQQDENANATEAQFGKALVDVREMVEAGRNGA